LFQYSSGCRAAVGSYLFSVSLLHQFTILNIQFTILFYFLLLFSASHFLFSPTFFSLCTSPFLHPLPFFYSYPCYPILRESLQSLLATQIVDEECGTSRYNVSLQSPFLTCARDLLLISDYGVLSLGGGRDRAGSGQGQGVGAGIIQGRV
jgi:hypothetical protein